MGERVLGTDSCWIFFAIDSKPTSMRRAIAERLAAYEQVLIVDRPVSLIREPKSAPFRTRLRPLSSGRQAWHYRPLHSPERLPGLGRISRMLNERRLCKELDQALPDVPVRRVCFDSPSQHGLVGRLRETLSIYLAVDDRTVKVTGEPIRGEQDAERKLLAKIDLVICVSETLADTLRSRSPSSAKPPIVVLPNSYDERIFAPEPDTEEPAALHNVARPRILIAGHISERIDWAGLEAAARLRPEWTWVFVGPADPGIQATILLKVAGKGSWHPPIPVTEIPRWIEHCDACAVPYQLNPFTQASFPLKMIECLAMGAPVLSTKVPSLQKYDGVVAWVEEGEGESYALALDRLIAEARRPEAAEARRAAVRHDSWAYRLDQFKDLILNGRGIQGAARQGQRKPDSSCGISK